MVLAFNQHFTPRNACIIECLLKGYSMVANTKWNFIIFYIKKKDE